MKLNKIKSRMIGALTVACLLAPANAALALDEITVAYFLEWPSPNLLHKADGRFEKEMGVKVNWRAFGNGNEMTAAMVSGDVQIAYSQGLTPFVVGVTKGAPLKLVSAAVSYAENDNCIVHKDSGITQANAKELEGKKVASPIGNVTHYKMLKTLQHLGVDTNKINLLQMNPPDGAAALARGDVAMACGFGGALQRMKKFGSPLMTAKEQEAIGIRVFDIVSVTNDFAQDYPDLVVSFLQITEDANNLFRTNPSEHMPVIAKESGQNLDDALSMINLFEFPTRDEQLSDAWMGKTVNAFVNEVADFYVQEGSLPKALDDYSVTMDDSFIRQVK
ncbi:ABC transporter substrate-binding protein [Candidatus Persebacteraceae bacterium Df01]|jgi:taurine transport system substrate-binding protein|uniref:ABC transporter substrate-binding protein n=1 Tax=Candidatus Doriopsillibacter californiensis TaxID=2970740 RepID=A0ABT7QMS7_9GAMM|nr:ABC transporter substrate-binding protein [Candidatus Persebacteraceae bacterium Df01]